VAVYLAGLVTYAAVDPWKSSTTTTRAASPQSAATIVPSSSDARRSGVEVANLPAVVGPSADAQSPEAQRLAALGGYLNAFWSDQFAVPIYAGHVWRPVTTLFVNTDSTACDGANALKFQDFFCPSEYFVELAVPRAIPGAATPARNFIIAHEWGHAVQESANVQASDKLMELQADCFAGAFLKHASESTLGRSVKPSVRLAMT
jgi:predicted metalloprotease